jgi:DNA helicase-2/ATP-dependent DNA helicase PcrA
LGQAKYLCPEGEINGELSLKRQFTIEAGELREIFDIDITTNDQFLQAHLGASADNRLKEIVSTIQAEQNRIIRADLKTPLIIQGVAGSGKTTIALHRIAYLIYNYEGSFRPENFMIIAPNRFFLNYISEVLPELGVERVRQTTFEEFALDLIGEKIKVKDANYRLTDFLTRGNTSEAQAQMELEKQMIAFKSSMAFKEILDQYMAQIEQTLIPETDFRIGDWVIYSHREILELFFRDYRSWPVLKRVQELKKHFNKRLKDRKEEYIEKLQSQCQLRIERLKLGMPESEQRHQLIIETIDRKNERVKEVERFVKEGVKEYFNKISKLSPVKYYRDLLTDPKLLACYAEEGVSPELLEFLRRETLANLNLGRIELEDLAPLVYLKFCFYGLEERIPVRHIVIDEAQDFSVFQLYAVKKIIKDSSFTIFGDLSQGIHSYRGLNDWQLVRREVFEDEASEFLTLEQSYRTTVEIMEAANKVISRINKGQLVLARPVVRHGDKVQVIKKNNITEIVKAIEGEIAEIRETGYQSIAVICKTIEECKKFAKHFKTGKAPVIMTGKETEYRSGLVMLPSYLAKGLEFDAVIIANADNVNYRQNELDTKLLYVMMTRPLHKLYIYYTGELTPLLSEVD